MALASSPSPWSSQSRALLALVMVSSVVNVFEEMMKSVSAGSRSRVASNEINAIHIGHEPEGHGAFAIVPKRLVGHDRTEV